MFVYPIVKISKFYDYQTWLTYLYLIPGISHFKCVPPTILKLVKSPQRRQRMERRRRERGKSTPKSLDTELEEKGKWKEEVKRKEYCKSQIQKGRRRKGRKECCKKDNTQSHKLTKVKWRSNQFSTLKHTLAHPQVATLLSSVKMQS